MHVHILLVFFLLSLYLKKIELVFYLYLKYFSKHAPIQTLYQSYLYNYSKPISIFDQLNVPLVLSTLKHLISSAIWIPFISFILTFYFFWVGLIHFIQSKPLVLTSQYLLHSLKNTVYIYMYLELEFMFCPLYHMEYMYNKNFLTLACLHTIL